MTSPCFTFLKSRFPNSSLHLLTNAAAASLYKGDPSLSTIHTFDWPWSHLRSNNKFTMAKLRRLFQLVVYLKKERFDLMIDFRGDIRFVVLFGVLIRAKIRIGNSRSGDSRLLHHVSQYELSRHEVERALDVVSFFGEPPGKLSPHIPLSTQDRLTAVQLIQEVAGGTVPEKKVILAPYSSKDIKSWPVDYFMKVIAFLSAHEYHVFVVGAKGDAANAADLAAPFGKYVYSIAGLTSLRQLAALTALAELVVGVDTGVLHIASCYNTPIVAIFGPTRAVEYRPYSSALKIADSQSCTCNQFTHSSCSRHTHGYAGCMNDLQPEAVINAIKGFM